MRITSFYFLIFLMISVIIYYVFPKKHRWIVLLGSSIVFFLCASSWKLLFYVLIGIVVTYIGARAIREECKTDRSRKWVLAMTLLVIVGELFYFKYINIFPLLGNSFGRLFGLTTPFGMISLLAPLGISYYTLSLIGYVVDVYRTTSEPSRNIFKHALFACYYPIMVSGPIVRYQQMESELFQEKKFDIENIYRGFARIIYGLLKKLVIADQLAVIVATIFGSYTTYHGFYIVLGLACYAVQIYTDFSGCMDIVIGASKMYNVTLPENFDSPFFSRNLSEFWRRWHISLGTWAKDYIMYPLLKSHRFQSLAKKCRKVFGKKIGKKIPTILSILILWLLIGLWHGASYQYIFAAGIVPWVYLTVSELFEGVFKKINEKFHIKTECFSFHLFQSLRTFGLMCFLWLFVCSPWLFESISVLRAVFEPVSLSLFASLPKIGFSILVPCIFVLVVDYLNYKKIDVEETFQNQNIWFRYLILLLFIAIILIWGSYGPGYNASDFIYGGF